MIIVRQPPQGTENLIEEISAAFSLSKRFARILVARGISSVAEADEFLHPEKIEVKDPFLTHGIKSAVDRITSANENGETVVVFGDYDADGITATTIAVRSLKEFGIEAIPVIPERENGYGLTPGILEEVLENYCPDLILTVDCGISAASQIEELADLGVDVIVTDHHELPDELPHCVVVNCKIDDGFTFNGLCGAGVAFKLAHALIGDKADKYIDLAAIATVADSMPLTGENRKIVAEGVKNIDSGKCCKVVKALVKASGVKESVSATTLAYVIAPRINAYGRMGNARLALKAFLSDDDTEIREIVEKLNAFNAERQTKCDELYKSAKEKLARKSPLLKVNVLCDEKWNTGLVGIVAAKLVEETQKPTILFTERDGLLHGSARSVAGLNIYEALKYAQNTTEDFGGHAQAAGVTIKPENIDLFEAALDEYMTKNCDIKSLDAVIVADELTTEPFSLEFAEELEKIEPCGTGNKKPSFVTCVYDAGASPLKYGSPHLSFSNGLINMLYFGGEADLPLLNSPIKKMVMFEPNISCYNGQKSVKGYVRAIETVAVGNDYASDTLFSVSLDNVNKKKSDYKEINSSQAEDMIELAKKSIYGTLFIISAPETYERFTGLKDFPAYAFSVNGKNNVNSVCFGLKGDIPAGYTRAVYLDLPLNVVDRGENADIFVNTEIKGFDASGLTVDRDSLGGVYLAVKRSGKKFVSVRDVCTVLGNGYSPRQIKFAVKVFKELGFIKNENGKFFAVGGSKRELTDSPTYKAVKAYIEDK